MFLESYTNCHSATRCQGNWQNIKSLRWSQGSAWVTFYHLFLPVVNSHSLISPGIMQKELLSTVIEAKTLQLSSQTNEFSFYGKCLVIICIESSQEKYLFKNFLPIILSLFFPILLNIQVWKYTWTYFNIGYRRIILFSDIQDIIRSWPYIHSFKLEIIQKQWLIFGN